MSKKLDNMSLSELWKRFREATGKETKSPNKKFLITQITEAEEAKREGARSDRRDQTATATRSRANEAATEIATPAVGAKGPERDDREADVVDAPPTGTDKARETEETEADVDAPPAARSDTPVDEQPAEVLDEQTAIEIATYAGANADDERDDDEYDDENDGDDHSDPVNGTAVRADLRGKTTDQLRAIYVEKVGRETDSVDSAYLKWKIREAEKGRGSVGPGQRPARAPRTTRRFEDVSTADLEKLFEEKARRKPDGIGREALIAGIVTAEKGAAKAARRFADVTVGNLQQMYEKLTGEATESLARDELITAILTAEKARAPKKAPREPKKPRVPVPFGMFKDALARLDETWPKHGYSQRIDFLREAVRGLLLRHGEGEVAALFTA